MWITGKNKYIGTYYYNDVMAEFWTRSNLQPLDSIIPHIIRPNLYENGSEQEPTIGILINTEIWELIIHTTFSDTIRVPNVDVNLARVPSDYLRQLTAEGLLIPRHMISLTAKVGQGQISFISCAVLLKKWWYLSGEFGVVYKASLNGWQGNYEETVAVKTLKGTQWVQI